ncbi:MAG: response regulator transcription factor, partial [Desulfobacterales bacterium]|nr:response regulator transcription factor [Desulfobacterales bacterium]
SMAFAGALSKGNIFYEDCPHLEKPIYENIVFPVYDEDGNLKTTLEFNIDTNKRENKVKEQEKKIEALESKLDEIDTEKNDVKNNIKTETDLTKREIEVLQLIAEGATNTEISDKLFISPHTVKSHVIHIFNKLGVNDRTQAAVWAIRNNIL